jgi:hypothetical protein
MRYPHRHEVFRVMSEHRADREDAQEDKKSEHGGRPSLKSSFFFFNLTL